MYSNIITPVSTDTPKSARNPTPEETLRCVPVISNASSPPMGAIATLARINPAHFAEANMVYRTMKITRIVMGTTIISRFWERFWLSYSPAQSMIADRQLYFAAHELHRFFHRAAEVPASNAVLDGDVAGIFFAID